MNWQLVLGFGFWIVVIALIVLAKIRSRRKERKIEEESRRWWDKELKYRSLEKDVLKKIELQKWENASKFDDSVVVKSRQALEQYDVLKFFKDDNSRLYQVKKTLRKKNEINQRLQNFVLDNEFKDHPQYDRVLCCINNTTEWTKSYRVLVVYRSSAGNNLGKKKIIINQYDVDEFDRDPTLLMSKGEYSRYIKDKEKEAINRKKHKLYDRVNRVIDYANEHKKDLLIKDSEKQLDDLVVKLFDRTINSIGKIKSVESDEWDIIRKFITQIAWDVYDLVDKNQKILQYYESAEFINIKKNCDVLMNSQREFNEYIMEKVQAVSQLFGTRVVRNETINDDEYNYFRPYKKTITPFTAEVSAAVFASAENNPIEYVIKYFYPDKSKYPEQIQKLHLLIEELATLKEAKKIIEEYKKNIVEYINDVPSYIMDDDESGFYSRLGFANIDDSILTVEYAFSYTSGGGMAKRTFTVPMTEDTIIELIGALERRLTITAFSREQRPMMTGKLREMIKKRDNFTCCICGNSIYQEPNLLLEIDHVIPVSKGGCTIEENLQTLCWKCNRAKSNKN